VVIFEGRDAAGKGGRIKRITQYLSARVARVAALPSPATCDAERDTSAPQQCLRMSRPGVEDLLRENHREASPPVRAEVSTWTRLAASRLAARQPSALNGRATRHCLAHHLTGQTDTTQIRIHFGVYRVTPRVSSYGHADLAGGRDATWRSRLCGLPDLI
jgi:hypothetical protein